MTYSDTYVGKLILTLRAAEDERDAALAQIARLREALRPFAEFADTHRGFGQAMRTIFGVEVSDDQVSCRGISLEDCRRAREALEQP